jgi:hypothetical protein
VLGGRNVNRAEEHGIIILTCREAAVPVCLGRV